MNGDDYFFEPIAIIEHQGILFNGGHYVCDVKDVRSNTWYRTNDSAKPKTLSSNNVTKQGYVVMYRRAYTLFL